MLPDVLIKMAATIELFHTATGTAFADLTIDGHRETWPIRSKRFRGWLRRRYFEASGEALGVGAVRSTLDLFEARAQFDAPERTVHIRVAEHAGRLPRPCRRTLACCRDRRRRMARHRISAGALPPASRHAAVARARNRRVD
jgi:hypothetical protein